MILSFSRRGRFSVYVFFVWSLCFLCDQAFGQATVTASRALSVTAFAGATGSRTGFGDARNLAITAGGDLDFRPASRTAFSLELRATYPVERGSLVAEKNLLVGPRVRYHFGRLEPYFDLLVGRGSLNFGPDGYLDPNHRLTYYTITDGNVFAAGGGVRYRLSREWAAVVDFQAQRYATPVASSGHIVAKAGTLGVAFTFPPKRKPCFICR